MNKLFLPVLVIAGHALLTGCGNKSAPAESATNAPSGSVITAPVDYLGAVSRAQQYAVKTIDIASIKSAIQMFQADEGTFPKDLNELVQKKFLGKIPETPYGMKLQYDPATGEIKVVKQ
jgi:hypothetical protein